MTCSSWRPWIVAILLSLGMIVPAVAHAQTKINLGKPTPNGQNDITVDVSASVKPLAPTTAACTAVAQSDPTLPAGQTHVRFTASTDHNVLGQGDLPKVDHYELWVSMPTPTQPCYTAQVFAMNASNASDGSAMSAPFPLALGKPAAPQGVPVILKR